MQFSIKNIVFFFVIIFSITLLSCENKIRTKFNDESASKFLNIYFEEWNKGNIDNVLDMTHGVDTLSDDALLRLKKSLNLGRKQLFEKNGGIKRITLRNLKPHTDPNTRISNYYVSYVKGGGMEVSRYLILENGNFKISLNIVE